MRSVGVDGSRPRGRGPSEETGRTGGRVRKGGGRSDTDRGRPPPQVDKRFHFPLTRRVPGAHDLPRRDLGSRTYSYSVLGHHYRRVPGRNPDRPDRSPGSSGIPPFSSGPITDSNPQSIDNLRKTLRVGPTGPTLSKPHRHLTEPRGLSILFRERG